jgi:hypothetical protein
MAEHAPEYDTRYKTGQVFSEYNLPALHEELPARWRGEEDDAESLRDLATRINVAILERAMERAGENPLEGEAENAHRLLTNDDISTGVRTQQHNRLERAGVDIDSVMDDFVTHQAVHTYLTDALEVSKDTGDTDPVKTHEQRIERLRNRTRAVIENSLSDLKRAGDIPDGSYNVLVDAQVYCSECDTQVTFSTLLTDGCRCE